MDFGIDAQIEFTAADEQGATHATGRVLSLQIKAMSVWLAGAGVKGGIVMAQPMNWGKPPSRM